jgi:hypothetical protein
MIKYNIVDQSYLPSQENQIVLILINSSETYVFAFIIPPLIEWGLYCNHLDRPSVHTFVTDISASTGRNDFIFDIWLWHGDLYRANG